MKNNHVLIDYENVQPELSKILADPVFKVWVFVGAQQAKVKMDLVDLLQAKGPDAKVIKMSSTGKNALDFHMSCYLGKLWAQEPEAYFHLVALDTGMTPLVEHLKALGVQVARWTSPQDIPITRTPATESEDSKLSRIIEYLVARGSQRPATLKTLQGSVAALFQPRLTEPQAMALIEQLCEQGVCAVQDKKLTYGLPD
jgi:PIN domain